MKILKKYPNRRIYDTQESKFITLGDIRTMIQQYTPFQVVDSKTGDDLTRMTLMQLVNDLNQEEQGLLTNKVLEELIRFYDNPMGAMLASYIEKSIKAFMSQEEAMRKQFDQGMMGDLYNDMYKQYSQAWKVPGYGAEKDKEKN